MKNKVLSVVAVGLLTSVTSLSAADIVGKWFAQIPRSQAPLGRFVLDTVFTFRPDGTKLLGTVSYPQGEETAISNGKVNGDQISFVVVRKSGERLVYKGIVAGDEIKFTQEIQEQGQPQEFIAKREFQRDQDVPIQKSLRR
jgi:hypothetical protein